MKKNTPTKQKLTKKHYIIIGAASGIFLILMSTIAYLLVYINNDRMENEKKKDDRPTVVTKENVDEVVASMEEPIEDGSYEVVMNTKWKFSKDASDAYVENSRSNTRTVYFDVLLADTNELVYSSPYIPVGEKIEGFALDTKLEPGDYKGLVTYHLVDDDKQEVSNLSVSVTFQVK